MVSRNYAGLNTGLPFTLSDQLDIFGIGLVSPTLFVNNIILYTRLSCAHLNYRQPREQGFLDHNTPDFMMRQVVLVKHLLFAVDYKGSVRE